LGVDIEGGLLDKIANMKYYVKCKDTHDNKNLESYILDICISQEPDNRSAEITAQSPASGSYIPFGVSEINANFWLNEPAECKWDTDENKNYNEMSNQMNCSIGLEDAEDYGWLCEAKLTNLTENENNIYIKCKDQPWLPAENDSQRNINQESFNYIIYKSLAELRIDKIEPNGVIQNGFEPISIDLSVETSGGVTGDGESTCSYNFEERNWAGMFYENTGNQHKQTFTTLMGGNYKINITCEDIAGNNANAATEFSLEVDNIAPIITRVYNSGGKMVLLTNEDAVCYYDSKRCEFNLENATSMTSSGYLKEHSAEWNAGMKYYLKCKDIWGNVNPGCAMIVKPSA